MAAVKWDLNRGQHEGILRDMKTKQYILAAMMTGALATPAFAQEPVTTATSGVPSIGVGAEAQLNNGFEDAGFEDAAALVYDMGKVRINGLLNFASHNGTRIGLGGRVLWVVHQGGSADFSVGGGLGLINNNPEGPGDSATDIRMEALAQIRAFLTTNVAVSSSLGFGVNLNDGAVGRNDDEFTFGAQLLSNAGLVYYFR